MSLCLSLYISHLDYCNAVLYNIPKVTLTKLQHIHNMCACLVLWKLKRDSISECLKQLHWLPIRQIVHFKILVLTYKCLHGQGLPYLIDLLKPQTPTRSGLRSSSSQDSYLHLSVPRTKCKTFADRSFSVGAPTLWNSLLNTSWRPPQCLHLRTWWRHTYLRRACLWLTIWPSSDNKVWYPVLTVSMFSILEQ